MFFPIKCIKVEKILQQPYIEKRLSCTFESFAEYLMVYINTIHHYNESKNKTQMSP
jgi:hypothetical protein